MVTIDQMEQAGRERHQDAIALSESGRFGGARYFSGYVAEIRLKVVFAKVNSPNADIGALTYESVEGVAKDSLNRRCPVGHDLVFWSQAIWKVANKRRKPIRDISALLNLVSRIAPQWNVEMRYVAGSTASSSHEIMVLVRQLDKVCNSIERGLK